MSDLGFEYQWFCIFVPFCDLFVSTAVDVKMMLLLLWISVLQNLVGNWVITILQHILYNWEKPRNQETGFCSGTV